MPEFVKLAFSDNATLQASVGRCRDIISLSDLCRQGARFHFHVVTDVGKHFVAALACESTKVLLPKNHSLRTAMLDNPILRIAFLTNRS
jgi:hypothetical protein